MNFLNLSFLSVVNFLDFVDVVNFVKLELKVICNVACVFCRYGLHHFIKYACEKNEEKVNYQCVSANSIRIVERA